MADISEFDAFAHDLRHYLREIVTHAQLGLRDDGNSLSPSLLEKLNRVVAAGCTCDELVQAMAAYQSADAKPDQRWPLKRLLQRLSLEAAASLAALKGSLHVNVSPSDSDVPLAASLQKVWAELLANAIKFRRPEPPPEIFLEISVSGDRLHFRVRDNGIGIAAEHRESVFVPFRRLNKRETYPGFGLGLATCRKLLIQLGGDLRVADSETGTVMEGWCSLSRD